MAVLPQFAILAATVALGWAITGELGGVILGSAVYLLYSVGSRRILARSHRRGMSLVRQGRFAEAIDHFQASYEFFAKYPWLDRHRAVLLLTPSDWKSVV